MVLTLLLCLVGVWTNSARMGEKGNTTRNKWIGVLTSFTAMISSLGAMGLFGLKCAYPVIEYYIDLGVNYTSWTAGPSVM